MSDEITKDRSPRSPMIALEEAIEITKRFYLQARTTAVKPESAVKAMGYSGMTGTSMTTLATLSQYGLIDRTNGNVSVSQLAIRILHPVGDQKEVAIREAALMPKVFQDILKGFEDCSAEIITNHLIQAEFAPDRARKVANVYIENRRFAKLDEDSRRGDNKTPNEPAASASTSQTGFTSQPHNSDAGIGGGSIPQISTGGAKMLAQYSIPLGENQATLVFTGSALTVEDFDALSDFVDFAKRQFARKTKAESPRVAVARQSDDDDDFGLGGVEK